MEPWKLENTVRISGYCSEAEGHVWSLQAEGVSGADARNEAESYNMFRQKAQQLADLESLTRGKKVSLVTKARTPESFTGFNKPHTKTAGKHFYHPEKCLRETPPLAAELQYLSGNEDIDKSLLKFHWSSN